MSGYKVVPLENRCEDPPTFSSGFCDVIEAGNTCQVPQRKHGNRKDALHAGRSWQGNDSMSKVLRRQSPDCYGTGEIGLILFEFLSPIATVFLPVPNMTENRCEDPPTFSSGFCDVIEAGNTCQVPQGNTAIVKTHCMLGDQNRCEDPPTFSSGFCDVIEAGNTCQVPQGNTAIVKTHYWEIVARKLVGFSPSP
ncbi:hypothetical protein Bbelb_313520 [Branchiostoma belcheri]|nr:hypothetical protein Bbelb_313520 [Branchiostoma belcheri]